MKEFAVYDNSDYRKSFIDLKNQQIILNLTNGGLKGLYGGDGYMKDWQLFQSVGIQDINGKSIYADMSIVEFDKYSCGHSEQLKGFIRESSPMIFQIVILDNDIWNVLYWHEFRHSIKNLKIIDTIQENKLGLIK